jgi:PRTRC genetic system protein B
MIHTDLGQQRQYKLQNVVCLYGDGSQAFATLHEVDHPFNGQGQPKLRPAQALTTAFLHGLQDQLGVRQSVEIFTEQVLARTPEMVAWYVPAAHRAMFFKTGGTPLDAYSGKRFPHPGLVFKLANNILSVRAVATNVRPSAATKLFAAPYYNIYANGSVCTGSMRTPDRSTVDVLDAWVAGFFASAFSHVAGVVKVTTVKGGYPALVKLIAGSKFAFPVRTLVDVRQSLTEFLRDGDL